MDKKNTKQGNLCDYFMNLGWGNVDFAKPRSTKYTPKAVAGEKLVRHIT